ncbi:MAG: hypothetical protein Q9226_003187 [Calogaya cf. arnoldii]
MKFIQLLLGSLLPSAWAAVTTTTVLQGCTTLSAKTRAATVPTLSTTYTYSQITTIPTATITYTATVTNDPPAITVTVTPTGTSTISASPGQIFASSAPGNNFYKKRHLAAHPHQPRQNPPGLNRYPAEVYCGVLLVIHGTISPSTITTTITTTATRTMADGESATTVTATAAAATTYLACSTQNLLTFWPAFADRGQGYQPSMDNFDFFDEVVMVPAKTNYDCCVACQTFDRNCATAVHDASTGVCRIVVAPGECNPNYADGLIYGSPYSSVFNGITVSMGPCGFGTLT